MTTINPIAGSFVDTDKQWWSGFWLAEDLAAVKQGIADRSWVETSLGGVGATLDGLTLVSDPLSSLLQYGLSWLMEHIRPLSEALDWLCGDADQIAQRIQAWRSVATDLRVSAVALADCDIKCWRGSAASAQRRWADEQRRVVAALADGAETMAVAVEVSGVLVAGVRLMVRDAIATVASRLVVYSLEQMGSFGFATPLVMEQVTTTVGAWAARISRWLRALLASLDRLMPLLRKVGSLMAELRARFGRPHWRDLDAGDALHRVRGKGAGPSYRMELRSVWVIAEKYGIDISHLKFTVSDRIRGLFGETKPNGDIILYRNAFQSEEDLAKTLVHEKFHAEELAAGQPYPTTRAEFDQWEDRAYAFEDTWYDGQPIRPEGT